MVVRTLKIHLEIAAFDHLVESVVISDFWLVDTLWSRRQFGVVICFKLPWWIGSLKNTIFASFFPDPNPFSPLVWWVFWLPHLRYLWCPSGGQEDQYFCHSCQALGAHFNFFQMTLLTLFATGNCNNLKPMGSPGFLLEGLKVVRLIRLRSLRLMVAREPGDWWKEFSSKLSGLLPWSFMETDCLEFGDSKLWEGEVWGASKSVARKSFCWRYRNKDYSNWVGWETKGGVFAVIISSQPAWTWQHLSCFYNLDAVSGGSV